MGRRALIVMVLAVGTLGAGCNFTTVQGSGNIVTEERSIPDRAEISVCCGFHLRLDVGTSRSFEITGDDNVLERLQVVGRGGRIVVEPTHSKLSFQPSEPVIVDVTLTDLAGVAVSGGGRAQVGAFAADDVRATLSGGSTATFSEMESDVWRPTVSGGGEVTVGGGSTERQVVDLSGGSQYAARRLASQRATVRASGGSRATVSVSESLEATASGGSRIEYIGRPSVDAETSGGGTVRRIEP